MNAKFTVNIPYGTRSQYLDFVYQINALASSDGLVQLFVNNTPYCLEAFLVIETDDNIEEIKSLIKKDKLDLVQYKGFSEFFKESIINRRYTKFGLFYNSDMQSIQQAFSVCFLFAEKDEIEAKGIGNGSHVIRKKLFISYCHKDKDIVYKTTESMDQYGLNSWIDKQDINVGDNILHSVLCGINESDLAVLFISKATLESNFSKLELETIMSAMMKKNMGWYIVKLDDVNPDKILPALADYKYYDFNEDNNIEALIKIPKNNFREFNFNVNACLLVADNRLCSFLPFSA